MEVVDVSAIIPTRGNVDMEPVIWSFPLAWEVVIWNNGTHQCELYEPHNRSCRLEPTPEINFMGYGRHAAIPHSRGGLVYTQDDDVIVSDPAAIVDAWLESEAICAAEHSPDPQDFITANLPENFRSHYGDSAMLGFGAVFPRWLPAQVFSRFLAAVDLTETDELFLRESDRALTVLTPFFLVDVEKEDREFASDPDRLWKQLDHVHYREQMLSLARSVRDNDRANSI